MATDRPVRRGRGRPPRADVTATCRIEIRCTPAERRELQRYADDSGMSVAEYMRLAGLLLLDELFDDDGISSGGK